MGPPTARRTSVRAPGVEPHEALADRQPGGVHRDGARPLPGARDGHDVLGRDHARNGRRASGLTRSGATTRRHPG